MVAHVGSARGRLESHPLSGETTKSGQLVLSNQANRIRGEQSEVQVWPSLCNLASLPSKKALHYG